MVKTLLQLFYPFLDLLNLVVFYNVLSTKKGLIYLYLVGMVNYRFGRYHVARTHLMELVLSIDVVTPNPLPLVEVKLLYGELYYFYEVLFDCCTHLGDLQTAVQVLILANERLGIDGFAKWSDLTTTIALHVKYLLNHNKAKRPSLASLHKNLGKVIYVDFNKIK